MSKTMRTFQQLSTSLLNMQRARGISMAHIQRLGDEI